MEPNQYIVKGYKGIMDLDLTHIDIKYHKSMIQQHKKDIKLYKQEQSKLPEHLQYENTIMRAERVIEMNQIYKLKKNNEVIQNKH